MRLLRHRRTRRRVSKALFIAGALLLVLGSPPHGAALLALAFALALKVVGIAIDDDLPS